MLKFTDNQFVKIKSKLILLNFPDIDIFEETDETTVKNVVVWLEDRVIRCLPVGERRRDVTNTDFYLYLAKYLQKLSCPFGMKEPFKMLDFLLTHAISLYQDDNNNSDDNSLAIFKNIDFSSQDFVQGVEDLSGLLGIPHYEDHLERFKACCLVINQKLSAENFIDKKKTLDRLSVDQVIIGFDIPDPDLKSIAIAARLLNISEMRLLQDQINAAIVQVQRLTADPKTNEKLGQVGY